VTTEEKDKTVGGEAVADGERKPLDAQDAAGEKPPQPANDDIVLTPEDIAPDQATAETKRSNRSWTFWAVPAAGVLIAVAGSIAAYLWMSGDNRAWENCKTLDKRTPEQRIQDCGAVILGGEKPARAMAQARRIRGRAFFDIGEVASAVQDYSDALSAVTDDATLYSERGFAHLRNGQPDKAIADFNAAVGLDASLVEPLIGRGNAYLALKQPEQAVQDFSVAVTLKPDFAEAFYRRALANVRLNNIAEASADYDRALELSPNLPSYWNARCWFRATMSIDLDLALADCEQALKLRPTFAPAMDSRAFVLLRLGRLEDALAAYDKAIAAESRYAWPYFGRGIVKKRLGDEAGATADFTKAEALQPGIAQQYANYGETP
jgi:tetratricopeptide (TPR) repeat protein